MKHKDGCRMIGLDVELINTNPNGPDQLLNITEDGIRYKSNIYTENDDDFNIEFLYCPVCGVSKNQQHNWKVTEVGSWFTEETCIRCGKKIVEEPDATREQSKEIESIRNSKCNPGDSTND